MADPRPWVVNPDDLPHFERPNPPATIVPVVNAELCGAEQLMAGVYYLKPGLTSKQDIHDQEELYYVVAGTGRIVLGGQPFTMEKGMIVYIPPNCSHQTTNVGEGELVLFWMFGTPPSGSVLPSEDKWAVREEARP